MRGRKRHLKKAARKRKAQVVGASSVAKGKKKATASNLSSISENAGSHSVTKFACYGKSRICHIVTVDDQGVIIALCGDVWTPGDEKSAPRLLGVISDDRRLCKKCEKKQ